MRWGWFTLAVWSPPLRAAWTAHCGIVGRDVSGGVRPPSATIALRGLRAASPGDTPAWAARRTIPRRIAAATV